MTLLLGLFYGTYNLLDWLLFQLASPFEPRSFASNMHAYTLPEMLGFLPKRPFVEIASISTGPAAQIPLALLRILVAILAVLVGFVALPLHAFDVECRKLLGERANADVVAIARRRQGRLEAAELEARGGEDGDADWVRKAVRAWDARGEQAMSK
jgi:hypothetical protein